MQESNEQPTIKFSDLPIGTFFLCRCDSSKDTHAYYGWTKLDETSARATTPMGQIYGEPVAFNPDAEPWVQR